MRRLRSSQILLGVISLLFCQLSFALEKVVIQLPWTHQFEFAGFYAALEKGFYQHEGLEVEIRAGGVGKSSLSEVLNNSATFGVTGSELLLARASGQPLVALGVIFQHSAAGLLTLADSDIFTPQDFSGRKLEMGDLSTDAEAFAVLQAEGITARQYEHIPSTFSMQNLVNKQSDVVSVYTTNQPFYLDQQNIPYRLISPRSYGIDFYGNTIFSHEETAKKRPELIEAFMRASLRGWRYAFDRPNELINIILDKYSDFPFAHSRKHLEFEYQQMKTLVLPDLIELGHMNPGRWRHMANVFVSLGLLQPDYNLDGFIWNPLHTSSQSNKPYIEVGIVLTLALVLMLILLVVFNRRLQTSQQQQQALEAQLKFSQSKEQVALWGGSLGYWHWDRQDNTLFLDELASTYLGGIPEAKLFQLKEMNADSNSLSVRNFFSLLSEPIRSKKGRFEIEAQRQDDEGKTQWLICRGEATSYTEEGSLQQAQGVLRDVSDLRVATQQVEQLAITDSLTGILNRRYFISRLSAFMQRVKFGDGHFAVILINIDNMEKINAEYGEHTGDNVIETLADIIQQQMRPLDLVARYGGQEFAVLLPNTTNAEATQACERICNYIAHYRFDTGSYSFFATVTSGIIDTQEFSLTELNSKLLLHNAEERVRKGKSQGKNQLISA
ncbi:diguanylate cyclase (GGDEF) domain-containing protein [Oceanospirillum multiglobuliferum]|uniref:Thiamine pyrimidine synthase n=1 Tax=Oceanospirillum multiglobuliferum TaxID=64969 RepID=A0A1T4SLF9_9GAMM|nr:ABC transporter substrate-binding protein [Oceanospirillum multiglobuliferum]OPX54200.1 hypothetical protein BTE48_15510 [Oceanospirillum multiglobuliferum]SKA29027.1 diguanylate cyclase (GGDEF) domain-containing protein [Oceanospirillum multiglobuliferum]